MNDQALLELFYSRSESAISETQKVYGPMCQTIAWNLLGNREDAQECVNDAMYQLWDTVPPERPENLRAYLARITRNLAMKRLRHDNAKKRQAVTVSFEEINQCIPSRMQAEDLLHSRELSRLLDTFLDTLDLQQRNLFLRRYWFFDSVKTLAASVRMSESKVKVTLHRIRKKLKEYLEKEADIYVG